MLWADVNSVARQTKNKLKAEEPFFIFMEENMKGHYLSALSKKWQPFIYCSRVPRLIAAWSDGVAMGGQGLQFILQQPGYQCRSRMIGLTLFVSSCHLPKSYNHPLQPGELILERCLE